MQRVLVIGPCGSGKSTLARELAPLLGLPLFHMDQLNWKAGWVESDKEELRLRVREIAAQERWLIDGNYGGTLAPRLNRAELVIYLDFPITLCIWRILRRIWSHKGATRPDMTEGCPERFDWAFLFYMIGWNFGPRPRTEVQLAEHGDKIIRLKNPRSLRRWRKEHGLG